jgi:hypothetical protein
LLDSRDDDLKSGRVKPIPGDEVEKQIAAEKAIGSVVFIGLIVMWF